jgi:serine/threonine protein kinase
MKSIKLKEKQACFIAPEMTVFGQDDPADNANRDMWSIGVLAYFFLTGTLEINFREKLDSHFKGPIWTTISADAK